jgi:alginate O-acetyltransferase complex protein AlgI
MIAERQGLAKWLKKTPAFIQNTYSLLVVVFAFVWFRLEHFSDALTIQKSMLGFSSEKANFYDIAMFTNPYFWTVFVIAVIASMPVQKALTQRIKQPLQNALIYRYGVLAFYGFVFFISIISMVNSTYNPFIYFRF